MFRVCHPDDCPGGQIIKRNPQQQFSDLAAESTAPKLAAYHDADFGIPFSFRTGKRCASRKLSFISFNCPASNTVTADVCNPLVFWLFRYREELFHFRIELNVRQ